MFTFQGTLPSAVVLISVTTCSKPILVSIFSLSGFKFMVHLLVRYPKETFLQLFSPYYPILIEHPLFTKHNLSSGNTMVNKTKYLPSQSLHSSVETQNRQANK